jgi:hypothetical protein
MPLSGWAKELGVSLNTLRTRAARGYAPEEILFGKKTKHGSWEHLNHHYKGEVRSLKEIAAMTGISYHKLRYQLKTNGRLKLRKGDES